METSFAAVLSQLRKEHGISQKQAALDLGISQALLSHYEKGIRECGLGFVVKAANYYHVTSDYLLGLSQIKLSPFQNDGEQETGAAPNNSDMVKAVCTLLYLSQKNRDGELAAGTNKYYMLCLYRAAVTAGQQGLLPREMFHLDFQLGRALSTAAIALEDAKACTARVRNHRTTKTHCALEGLIEAAEDYLITQYPLASPDGAVK